MGVGKQNHSHRFRKGMERNDRFTYILGFMSNPKGRIVGIINELKP